MQVLLDGAIDLKDQSSRDWNELFNAINRVVLIVPIPCDGTEYKPPKSSPPCTRAQGRQATASQVAGSASRGRCSYVRCCSMRARAASGGAATWHAGRGIMWISP